MREREREIKSLNKEGERQKLLKKERQAERDRESQRGRETERERGRAREKERKTEKMREKDNLKVEVERLLQVCALGEALVLLHVVRQGKVPAREDCDYRVYNTLQL